MQWITPVIIVFLILIVAGFFFYLVVRKGPEQPEATDHVVAEGDDQPGNEDVDNDSPDGYEFIAHLRLSTPLAILNHHYETHPGPRRMLPKYGNIVYGSWMLALQSWEDAISSSEVKNNDEIENELAFSETETIESDIGVMPVDGGTYLEFLKAFRRIIESDADPDEKRSSIYALAIVNDDYRRFISKHAEEDENWLEPYLASDN